MTRQSCTMPEFKTFLGHYGSLWVIIGGQIFFQWKIWDILLESPKDFTVMRSSYHLLSWETFPVY